MTQKSAEFLKTYDDAIQQGNFVKLTCSGYTGVNTTLKKITARQVTIKRVPHISLTYTHQTNDVVKNYTLPQFYELLSSVLLNEFNSLTVITANRQLQFQRLPGNKEKLHAVTHVVDVPSDSHNREKQYEIPEDASFLRYLNIADDTGKILKAGRDKFVQINHFVSLLKPIILHPNGTAVFRAYDMGSGKGYLTFALYYLLQKYKAELQVTGIELRPDLTTLCNNAASQAGFTHLHFLEGSIASAPLLPNADLVMALHACDTATDDAIYKAIASQAKNIVVAPCCHKQIRKQMIAGHADKIKPAILRHGIFLERQAEMVTDALRALIMEYYGYSTTIMEFIATAHTPKNILITGKKTNSGGNIHKLQEISALKREYRIQTHYLETLLKLPAV